MDKAMLEQEKEKEFIAMLKPVALSKGIKGGDCNGNTLKLL